jgi:hypothetical protein
VGDNLKESMSKVVGIEVLWNEMLDHRSHFDVWKFTSIPIGRVCKHFILHSMNVRKYQRDHSRGLVPEWKAINKVVNLPAAVNGVQTL